MPTTSLFEDLYESLSEDELLTKLANLNYPLEEKFQHFSFCIQVLSFEQLETWIESLTKWNIGVAPTAALLEQFNRLMQEKKPSAPPDDLNASRREEKIENLDQLKKALSQNHEPILSSRKSYLSQLKKRIQFKIPSAELSFELHQQNSTYYRLALIYLFHDNGDAARSYLKTSEGLNYQIGLLRYVTEETGASMTDWVNETQLLNQILNMNWAAEPLMHFNDLVTTMERSPEKGREAFLNKNFTERLKTLIRQPFIDYDAENLLFKFVDIICKRLSGIDKWVFIIACQLYTSSRFQLPEIDHTLCINNAAEELFNSDTTPYIPYDLLFVLILTMEPERYINYLWKSMNTKNPDIQKNQWVCMNTKNPDIQKIQWIGDEINLLLQTKQYSLDWTDPLIVKRYTNCVTREALENMPISQQVSCMLHLPFNAWREVFHKTNYISYQKILSKKYTELMQSLSLCALYFLNRNLQNIKFYVGKKDAENGWAKWGSYDHYCTDDYSHYASEYYFKQAAKKALAKKIEKSPQTISQTETVSVSAMPSAPPQDLAIAELVTDVSSDATSSVWLFFVQHYSPEGKAVTFENSFTSLENACNEKKSNERTILLKQAQNTLLMHGKGAAALAAAIQTMDIPTYSALIRLLIDTYHAIKANYKNKKSPSFSAIFTPKHATLSTLIISIHDLWINNDISKEWDLFQALDPALAHVNAINRNLTQCKSSSFSASSKKPDDKPSQHVPVK